MGTQNEQIDDGLTDEERAALAEDDGSGAGSGEDENNEGEREGEVSADENAEAGSGEGAGADADGAGADDAAAAAAAAADAEQPGNAADDGADREAAAEGAPILVVQPPADADAKLSEIATKKEELLTKFDDGDITAKEYQKELDALARQEREIEWAQREAELAGKLEAQRQANEWKATVDSFIAANPRYNPEKSESMYKLLDLEVRRVAVTDEFKGRNDAAAGREILQRAHENIAKDLGFDAKPAAKAKDTATQAKPKKPDLPPSLHSAPAAEQNDTTGGKFAVLDRLSTTDPIGYEEALMKLSDADRNAYLSAA